MIKLYLRLMTTFLPLLSLLFFLVLASCGRNRSPTLSEEQEADKVIALTNALLAKGADIGIQPTFVRHILQTPPRWIRHEIIEREIPPRTSTGQGVAPAQKAEVVAKDVDRNILQIARSDTELVKAIAFKDYLKDLLRMPPSRESMTGWSKAEMRECATQLINKTVLMAQGRNVVIGETGPNNVILFCNESGRVTGIIWTGSEIWSCTIDLDEEGVDTSLKELASYLQGIKLR